MILVVLIEPATSLVLIGAAIVARGFGIGMSMCAAHSVLRPEQVNDATPQRNVLQRVGGSIGTAIADRRPQRGISGLASPSPTGIARAFPDTHRWVLGISLVAPGAAT